MEHLLIFHNIFEYASKGVIIELRVDTFLISVIHICRVLDKKGIQTSRFINSSQKHKLCIPVECSHHEACSEQHNTYNCGDVKNLRHLSGEKSYLMM